MENSNRNHRVLAGVLTAAMVLSSFSMGTAGAFAAGENGPVAEKLRTELRQAGDSLFADTSAELSGTTAVFTLNNGAAAGAVKLYKNSDKTDGEMTGVTGAISGDDGKTVTITFTTAPTEAQTLYVTVTPTAGEESAVSTLSVSIPKEITTVDSVVLENNATTTSNVKTAIAAALNNNATNKTNSLAVIDTDIKLYASSNATEEATTTTFGSSKMYYTVAKKVGFKEVTAKTEIAVTKKYAAATSVTVASAADTAAINAAIKAAVATANSTEESNIGAITVAEPGDGEAKYSYTVAAKGDFAETKVTGVTVNKTKAYKTATAVTLASADATVEKLKDNLAGQIAQSTEDEATVKTALKVYKKTEDASEDAYGTEVTTGAVKDGEKYGYTVSGVAGYDAGDETKHDITVTVTTEKKDYVLTDASVKTFKLTGTETLADLKDKIVVAVKAKNDGATLAASDVTLTTAEGDATETTKPADVKGYKIAAVGTYKAGTVTDVTVTVEAKAEATATTTTLAVTNTKPSWKGLNTYGDELTLTATVTAGETKPEGKVAFYDGDTEIAKDIPVVSGIATTSTTKLGAGKHQAITAKFTPTSGDYGPSTSSSSNITIERKSLSATIAANQTVTFNNSTEFTDVKLENIQGVVNGDSSPKVAASISVAEKDKNVSSTGVDIAKVTNAYFVDENGEHSNNNPNYYLSCSNVKYKTDPSETPITVTIGKSSALKVSPQTVAVKYGTKDGTIDLATELPISKTYNVGTTDYSLESAISDSAPFSNIKVESGKLTYTVAEDAAEGATQAVSVKVTTNNYNDTTVVLTLQATKQTIVDTTKFAIPEKVYDGNAVVPTWDNQKFTETNGTVTYAKADGSPLTEAPKNAGSYTATFKAPTGESGQKTISFEIAKATVTVTAPDATITVGDTYDTSKYKPTVTGFIGDDEKEANITLAVFLNDCVINKDETKNLPAGTYSICIDGMSYDGINYNVVMKDGTLTVKAKSTSGGGTAVITPSTPSEPTVAPVQVTATAASSNTTVKAALDKIVAGKDDKSVVATFKKTDKKIAISATTLAGQSVYIYKLVGNTLAVVDNKAEAVGKDGTLTMDNPEAAVTKKLARTADDSTVTYVLIPATEKPPVASVSGTVEVAQGNVVLFDVTSGKSTDAGFAAGNDAVSETRLYTAYKDGKASYGAYGHGKEGQTTGIYVNGVKLFDVKVVKAPYKSDTTVNITNKKHGAMYWFEITPDNASATVSYTAGNGAVLSTRSKGKQKDGSYLFGFQITGKTGDKSGVYVQINGQNYCVFNVTVA